MFNADAGGVDVSSYILVRIRKSSETIKHINTNACSKSEETKKNSSLLWW